jgi:hypothetical protein
VATLDSSDGSDLLVVFLCESAIDLVEQCATDGLLCQLDLLTAQWMIYVNSRHETNEEDDDPRDSKQESNSKQRCRKDQGP